MKRFAVVSTLMMLLPAVSMASTIKRVGAYDGQGNPLYLNVEYPAPKAGYKEVVVRPGFDPKDGKKNRDQRVEIVLTEVVPVQEGDCGFYTMKSALAENSVESNPSFKYYEMQEGMLMVMPLECGNRPQRKTTEVTIDLKNATFKIQDAIVLHVPNDVRVSYRIWTAGPTQPVN